MGMPDALLNSKSKFSDAGFNTIRQHPTWGGRVARQALLLQTVINVILYHHERYDKEGYPSMQCGKKIPIEARIVTIEVIYLKGPIVKHYHGKRHLIS